MKTINISINDLIAVAEESAMIVSDNTGYQIRFAFDAAWDAYPAKTAVFVWYRDSLAYCQNVAFEGDVVTVPRLPAVHMLYVGVMAGNLQTTTPAQIRCQRSILSSGGAEPEPPTPSEYAQLMTLINRTQGASAYELALANGYKGTEIQWLASLRGPQGIQGIPGVQGPQGPAGPQGEAGNTPVRGEDYWTDQDVEQMQAYVDDTVKNTFGKGKSIPTNADLDTYTTIGKYYATSNAIAQSLINSPTKNNFLMYVYIRTTDNIPSQMVIDLSGKLYIRGRSSTGWRNWVTYITTDDLEDAAATILQEAKDSGQFQGLPGKDGYTPVKGQDYFTEADVQQLVERVLGQLPSAEDAGF